MKKALFISAIIVLFFIVIVKCSSGDDDHEIERKELVIEKHCSAVWDSIPSSEKKIYLQEFIEDKSIFLNERQHFDLWQLWDNSIKKSVKFPRTIRIDNSSRDLFLLSSRNAEIIDIDKGLIQYYEYFTSENKLSQKVKSTAFITVKYTAGCKGVTVSDFKIL